jgi:CysZ protein
VEEPMFDAAIKALTQMFSPPFRRVLLKSIGLALLMIILVGIGGLRFRRFVLCR